MFKIMFKDKATGKEVEAFTWRGVEWAGIARCIQEAPKFGFEIEGQPWAVRVE